MAFHGTYRTSRQRKRMRRRVVGATLVVLGILLWVGTVVVELASGERRDELLYLGIPLGGAAVVGGIILFTTAL